MISYGIPLKQVSQIVEYSQSSHYQLACQKYYETVHGVRVQGYQEGGGGTKRGVGLPRGGWGYQEGGGGTKRGVGVPRGGWGYREDLSRVPSPTSLGYMALFLRY